MRHHRHPAGDRISAPAPTLAVVPTLQIGRKEAVAVGVAVVLLVAAFVVPHLHLGIVTPLINSTPERFRTFAGVAPIFGWWNVHVGWGTPAAVLIGIAAVVWGPTVAARIPWRALTFATWATSCAWAFSLAMIDGWERGFAGRLTARHEYLRQVPIVDDIPKALAASPAGSSTTSRIRGSPTCPVIPPARC